ncbi:MAG: hypothetical protein WCO84_02480 [bacterium]
MSTSTEIIFNTVANSITSISAVIVAGVAIFGLVGWRKQMMGKTNYEIARKYLKASLKLRDAIKFVRNPFIPLGEMQSALEVNGFKAEEYSDNQKMNRAVYSVRWNKVREAWTNLEAELLEAEVSWGSEATKAQLNLDALVRELYSGLSLYLDGRSSDSTDSIIYNIGVNDEFSKKVDGAIKEIEIFLRPHLK